MIQATLAKLLTVKVAAVAIGFTALGGVALASGTGAPDQLAEKAPKAHPTAASASGTRSDGAGERKGPKATAAPKAKKNKDAQPAHGTPSPSMVGLCKAYSAKPAGQRGKALQSPAFTALTAAAGGQQKVVAYCTAVLTAKAGAAPKGHPTGKPADKVKPSKPAGPDHKLSATPTPRFTAN